MATVRAERCGHGEDAIYFDAPENRYIGLSLGGPASRRSVGSAYDVTLSEGAGQGERAQSRLMGGQGGLDAHRLSGADRGNMERSWPPASRGRAFHESGRGSSSPMLGTEFRPQYWQGLPVLAGCQWRRRRRPAMKVGVMRTKLPCAPADGCPPGGPADA